MMPGILALVLAGPARALPAKTVARRGLGPSGLRSSHERSCTHRALVGDLGDFGLTAVVERSMGSNHDVLAAWHRVTVTRSGAWQTGSAPFPRPRCPQAGHGIPPSQRQQFLNQATSQNPNIPEDVLEEQILDFLGDSWDTANMRLSGRGPSTCSAPPRPRGWPAGSTPRPWKATARPRAWPYANVGAAWYDLVAAQERRTFVREQVRVGEDLLQVVTLRYEGGEASALDVLQQKQQLGTSGQPFPPRRRWSTAPAGASPRCSERLPPPSTLRRSTCRNASRRHRHPHLSAARRNCSATAPTSSRRSPPRRRQTTVGFPLGSDSGRRSS